MRTVEGYADVIVMRHFQAGTLAHLPLIPEQCSGCHSRSTSCSPPTALEAGGLTCLPCSIQRRPRGRINPSHALTGSAKKAAEATNRPLINAGDGPGQHPTQALLDVYTIKKEIGRLDNIKARRGGGGSVGQLVHRVPLPPATSHPMALSGARALQGL